MHRYHTRFQEKKIKVEEELRALLETSLGPVTIRRAEIPTIGIYYYTDKDLMRAKKELRMILDEIEASDSPTHLVTYFFEYVWEHPYILDAYKSFKCVVAKKIEEIAPLICEIPLEKFQKLYGMMRKVETIL